MKTFFAVVASLLLCFAWHGGLPKTAPNTRTMALAKQPTLLAAAAIDLAATTGIWQVEDCGLVTMATLPSRNGDLVFVGLPNGKWYSFKL